MDIRQAPAGFLIKKINEMLKWRIDREMTENDTTMEQGHVIRILFLAERQGLDSLTMKDIEDRFSVAQSTAVGIISRLEKKGFVETFRDAEDRRVKRVRLTERGHGIHADNERRMQANEKLLVSGMTEAEQQEFRRLLLVVYNSVLQDTTKQKGSKPC